MTRLIDADALKELMIEVLEHIKENPKMDGQERHIIAGIHMLGEMIDDAPTVDAIPVKWLEDRRGEIANKLDEVAGVLDLEELAEAYCCQLNTINWLIDTWLERRFE